MSRLDFISDDELVLDCINQDLRKLEKHIVEGLQLSESQLLTLEEYRDRIDRLVAQLPLPSSLGADKKQVQPMASRASRKSTKTEVRDQPANELQQAIRECLGPDYS
jgi:hypothetical protein